MDGRSTRVRGKALSLEYSRTSGGWVNVMKLLMSPIEFILRRSSADDCACRSCDCVRFSTGRVLIVNPTTEFSPTWFFRPAGLLDQLASAATALSRLRSRAEALSGIAAAVHAAGKE